MADTPLQSTTMGIAGATMSAAALAVVVFLGGCGGDGDPGAFTDRVELPSCGVVDVIRGEPPIDSEEQSALDCFRRAGDAGTSAELMVITSTIEGDPVREWHRVVDADTSEVFVGAVQSGFGDSGWEWYRCGPVAFGRGGMPERDEDTCSDNQL